MRLVANLLLVVDEPLGFCGDGPGGVEVAVGDVAAVVASEDPFAEGQLGFCLPAGRTGLRRGVEAIDRHQTMAVVSGLVGKLAAQLTEGGIREAPARRVVMEWRCSARVLATRP